MVDKNIKILFVDDSNTMRHVIKKSLKELGFTNLVEAQDGDEAIQKIGEIKKIDLILCDWVMPKVSGLEVVKFVKSSDDSKHIPIIMITAEATRENVVQAIQAGIDDYMVKPFKPFALLAKIEKMFAEEE